MSLALIAEPSASVSSALRGFLERAGFGVRVVESWEEALAQLEKAAPTLLFTTVASKALDGAALCRQAKQVAPRCPVVLILPPGAENPESDSARAGADAYLVGPLDRGAVVACARAMLRVRQLLEQVERLEADLKRVASERQPEGEGGTGASTDFDFFKRLLLMEVKRSRRYRYPVAILLVGLDRFTENSQGLSPAEHTSILSEVLRAISGAVRDVDLAVPFNEGRYLLFLPHTPRSGALTVAARVRERIAGMELLRGMTASVGVAVYEPAPNESQVSFGGLMKQATEALRRAQVAGGDRVEAGQKAKRDRISLG